MNRTTLLRIWIGRLSMTAVCRDIDEAEKTEAEIKRHKDKIEKLEKKYWKHIGQAERFVAETWSLDEVMNVVDDDPDSRKRHVSAAKRKQERYKDRHGWLSAVDPVVRLFVGLS